jgi:hypothetical protein
MRQHAQNFIAYRDFHYAQIVLLSMTPLKIHRSHLFTNKSGLTKEEEAMFSHYRLWRLRKGTEFWAFILTLKFSTTRTALSSALRSGRTYPQGNSLVLISVRDQVDPRATECEQKE